MCGAAMTFASDTPEQHLGRDDHGPHNVVQRSWHDQGAQRSYQLGILGRRDDPQATPLTSSHGVRHTNPWAF
jgi:hypothetical protein